ncbi:MAG TPA: sugar-binding domain-containing protein [Microterricola sp.]
MTTAATRPTVSLDGIWALELDSTAEVFEVTVPSPWTTQVPGRGDSHETVRYRRQFEAPLGAERAARNILVFGGANHAASVVLNGQHIGGHIGGWTPFELDATAALRPGVNELVVEVSYPPRTGTDAAVPFTEVAHGKQSWYGTSAGIWQSVSLEQRPAQHLRSVVVRADAEAASITATVQCTQPGRAGQALSITVCAEPDAGAGVDKPSAAESITMHMPVEQGSREQTIAITLDTVRLWSPDDPRLYRVTVTLSDPDMGTAGSDSLSRLTGFRTVETRNGEILLNGEPIEIRAVLDQDYHPGSSTIPESDEALERLFREVQRLGFNMLRCHIKRPDRRYYELADRFGLLIWTELPSWLTMTQKAADDGAALLNELIDLDGHHPSIIIWTVINESWGIDLRDDEQRRWLRRTFDEVKKRAPHSLVVDNSACEPNFHLKSDLDDYHIYRGIPESRVDWDDKIAEFAGRPAWTFSPHGDAERTGQEPLLLSEYGNWGLPLARDQYGADGEEPWWFASGADWAFGAAEGTGLFVRFRELGLEDVFGSWERFVDSVQHAQMVANRYQTGSIRSRPEIAGYVLTQLSDVQWEANGLLDANRTPKAYNDDFALANGEFAIVLRPERYSSTPGAALAATVAVVPPRSGARWHGAVGEARLFVGGELVSRQTVPLDGRSTSSHSVGTMAAPADVELAIELWHGDTLLARDAATIVVVADESVPLERAVCAADAESSAWLHELGFGHSISGDGVAPEPAALLITRHFGSEAQAHARHGGRVLVLVEDRDALGDAFDFLPKASLGPRDGDGDWVPRQEWLRRNGAFAALPGGPLLGIAYENLLGELVITGIPSPMRPATVFSAIFSGWLRHSATTTATVPWSDGEVTITTFRVRACAANDPLARVLGRALVAHAARPIRSL